MTIRASLIASRWLAAAALLAACGSEPKLDVQTSSQEATPAATANVPVQPAHASVPTPGQPGEMPPGHPPLDAAGAPVDASAMALATPDPNAGQGATGMSWTAPTGWVAEPPSNAMRRAQYKVSGPGGDGECVVFYFGPGQGGGPMENAQRWASQFTPADGRSPLDAMKTSVSEQNGVPVLLVETAGTYNPGTMMGGPSDPRPGWALLGAVVQGPDSNWFFKFTAPAKTIEAQRASFEALVASVKRGS